MRKILILFLLGFLLSNTLIANEILQKGISLYESQKYNEAIKTLNTLVISQKDSINSPKATIILTKIYLNQDKLKNAQFMTQLFYENYSNSKNVSEMDLLSSEILIKQKNYDMAFLKLVELLKKSKNPYINVKGLEILKDIGAERSLVNINTLHEANNSTKSYPQINNIVLYGLALKSYSQNDFNSATIQLKTYINSYNSYDYHENAQKLLNKIDNRDYSESLIAVLVPLSGRSSAYGKMVLDAVKLKMKVAGLSSNLKIFDNESDPVVTIAKMKEIVNDKSIKAVIGPVASNNVIAAAAIASLYNLPMITPTATDDGIADIGNNIYQLNLTTQKLSQKIATYAIDSLQYKTYLIIAPRNSYGKKQAEEFEKVVSSKGGRVIKTQFYTPGEKDYKNEMLSIRRVLLTESIEEKNFKAGKTTPVDLSKYDKKKLDKEELHVDGIFVPATNSDELIMLIPQILYYRIYGKLLGSSSWYSNNIITNAKEYIDNSYFSLYFYKMDRFQKRLEFENDFEKEYGKFPNKVSYFSYDAAEVIINSMNKGNNTPSAINHDISKLNNYQGVSGKINFMDNSGANSEAEIIKINKNRFIKLDK